MMPFFSTPAVYNAEVYIGRNDGYVYRFDDISGQLTCHDSFGTSGAVRSSPAINSDGTRIVVANDAGYV